ncbi:MAG: membrane-bound O-acyltransferase family protein [Bacteroidetes bacterium]|nr:MAG: membrane-bound O-acyltransferase family protein [Bacteroidota bacterium]
MFFNSIDFAIFLPIVFVLYWFVTHRNLKVQNLLIVVASYFFYACWDWRFLGLILFSTCVDYIVGRKLKNEVKVTKRRIWLWTSIIVNIGLLGFFKYYNFFLDNFVEAYSFFGYQFQANSLHIVLPVGISFYTFQTLSYTIDVYKRKLEPTKDFIAFAAFVSFFPQLVAGPIERATRLLPQFRKQRVFNYSKAVDGMRQILWGLFKKIVIADNCAEFANQIFNNSSEMNGSTLVLGALFFSFQIYGDFSGYSDIAIGVSRLFGFDLMKNFAFPYFSRNVGEFWRRWHISLTTWFRDYLYIPLGGSRGGQLAMLRNILIIFVVSGFWHGANWTFIIWGMLNALYFIPLAITKNNRNYLNTVAQGNTMISLKEFGLIMITFSLITFSWIFFRADNLTHALNYITEIFSPSLFTVPQFLGMQRGIMTMILVVVFLAIEWKGREEEFAIAKLGLTWKRTTRFAMYYAIITTIYVFSGKEQQFIYFQF